MSTRPPVASNGGYRPVTGPITITIKEGMVVVAEHSYKDARKARFAARRWPQWMTVALRRIEREAAKR